jgi:hypothetical protein
LLSKYILIRSGLALAIVASLFSSFSPTAQAQTRFDESTPTETVTEPPTDSPTETPIPEATEVPDTSEIISIPTVNPDLAALETETPEDEAPALFAAQSFAVQSAPAFSPETALVHEGCDRRRPTDNFIRIKRLCNYRAFLNGSSD